MDFRPAQLVKKRVVLLVLVILLFVSVFLFFFRGNLISISRRYYAFTMNLSSAQFNKDMTIGDPFGNRIPFSISWEVGDKLVVSGYLTDNSIYKDNSITVKIPKSDYTSADLFVKGYFDKRFDSVLMLKTEDGKIGKIQEWKAVKIKDISRLIKMGSQIIIHFDIDRNKAMPLIEQLKRDHVIDLMPILRVII